MSKPRYKGSLKTVVGVFRLPFNQLTQTKREWTGYPWKGK